MATNKKKVALYSRVSTGHQDHGLQLDALRKMAAQRGWEVSEFIDQASGSGVKLLERDRMIMAASKGEIDVVAVWRFDRFARSLKDLLSALDSFQAWGVEFISLEEGIDTGTPMGRMLFSIMGALAEFEKALIRERVVAGIEAARKRGKKLGRPRVSVDVDRVKELRDDGKSWRDVARDMGVPLTTLRRAVKESEAYQKPISRRPR